VGQLIDLLTGQQRLKRPVGNIDRALNLYFPEGCGSWRREQDNVRAATAAATPSSVREGAVLPSLQLGRRVSLRVGAATCVSACLMRTQAAALMAAVIPEGSTVAEKDSVRRSSLVSLFEWSWKSEESHSLNGKKFGAESRLNLSSWGDGEFSLSTPTLEFLIDNLKTTMETLGELHQEVYHLFKKNASCIGTCLQSTNHFDQGCPSSSEPEPMPPHTPEERASRMHGSSGGCCPFQEEVAGSVLSYIESAMRDVVGKCS
jgi:hypothetical protein